MLKRLKARRVVRQARLAHGERRYGEAARLYERALRLTPGRAGLHVQSGHMFKEAGDLDRAEFHYDAADRLLPGNADLALQRGHFYKVAGRLDEALAAYAAALRLEPGWDAPLAELAVLRRIGWGGTEPAAPDLIAEIVPHEGEALLRSYADGIEVRRCGVREPGWWGELRTLRGVQAIRGFCISPVPIIRVSIFLNGVPIHRAEAGAGHPLELPDRPGQLKYVFNLWHDFSSVARGKHGMEVRAVDAEGRSFSFHDDVVVAEPLAEGDHPGSDAILSLDPADDRPLTAQIDARPSVVRAARRSLFPSPPSNILVLRTDQLGDMVASIPAMERLRALFPEARIVGLLTAANADLARTLDLFDEIIVIDFPDDWLQRRRLMPLEAQEALRRQLAPYAFDLAIDLAQAGVSRPLLRLSGARLVMGMGDQALSMPSLGFDLHARAPGDGSGFVPHAGKVLAMIEGLGAAAGSHHRVVRRHDLPRALLAQHGIGADDRYVLLHTGARIAFSRWPHYVTLARMILDRLDLKVVMMTEERDMRATLSPALLASDRFLFLDRRLGFDLFDAFVSHAEVMIGNDSGPKHLAALRGVEVITLFTARINWSEWGQEEVGSIISRKVPCAGCAIFHDAEECGRDFTCIAGIRPDEVFDTLTRHLQP